MSSRILTTEVRTEQDVVLVRQRARELARLLGFDQQDQTRVATAVSEIARNTYEYAKIGLVEFSVTRESRPKFRITVRDQGQGIPHLKEILDGQYRSRTGMGLGIVGAKRLMDGFQIETAPGAGTIVTLEKVLPAAAPPLSTARMGAISEQLGRLFPGAPLAELQEQNQELIRALDALQEKQQELILLNRELEETNRGVVALYGELDEKAEALKRADAMKNRFLSNITHEFRTPLGSTVNLAEMILDGLEGPLTESQRKIVGLIKKSNEGLLELVNDLLDLAKVEAGRIPVRPSEFALDELFGALRGLLRPLASKNREISLELDEPVGFPTLSTDEGKLTQILRNLISNAIKYTNRGEVRVSAKLLGGNEFEVSVSDTGIGIAPEDQQAIFEEFVQVESDLQRKHKGTGLGLALTRKLTELLGGRIRVESALGTGSVFSIRLPLRYSGPEEAQYISAEGAPQALQAIPKDGSLPVVLLVDDEPDERYFLRSALVSRFKCDVLEAATGAEGIRIAGRSRPELVFLDLSMPGMDGFEVLDEMKRSEGLRDVPVIIHSAKDLSPEDRERLRRAKLLLSKTRDSEEVLLQRVSQVMTELGIQPKS